MEIRFARADDIARLEALDARAWDPGTRPFPAEQPPDRVFGDPVPLEDVLVAEMDGDVAGYVMIGARIPIPANRHVGRIMAVAVDPRWRRRGLGRALLQAAEREAAGRGYRKLTLTVLGCNQPAIALYTSLGYAIEGRLVDEFELDGALVDDLFMAKHGVGQAA
jgi:ribosomal protein S18 acetylase RimI-like enzyme